MQSVGDKGPESLETEIHLFNKAELPVLEQFSEQYKAK